MSTMIDLKEPITKVKVTFAKVIHPDEWAQSPDKDDEGYWPSLDPQSPGYVGKSPKVPFTTQMRRAKKRMKEWNDGYITGIAVKARATVLIPIHGVTAVTYTLESPGLYGLYSDEDEAYINEVFSDQKEELKAHIQILTSTPIEFK